MGPVHGYEAEPVVWESTTDAVQHARAWLVDQREKTSDSKMDTAKG
jgi:hypothetical protein